MLTDNLRELFKGFSMSSGKFLGKLGVTPNMITSLVLIFGIIGAYNIYLGNFKIAIIFVLLSGIMDFFDGAIAKACQKETKFGGLFDSTTDKFTEIMVYISLGMYNPDLWLPASLAISFFMLSSYISKHAKASGGKAGGGILERKERIVLLVLGLIFIEYMGYILYVIAFFSLATAIQRFLRNYKALNQ